MRGACDAVRVESHLGEEERMYRDEHVGARRSTAYQQSCHDDQLTQPSPSGWRRLCRIRPVDNGPKGIFGAGALYCSKGLFGLKEGKGIPVRVFKPCRSSYPRNRSYMIHSFYCAHIQLVENNPCCRKLHYIFFNSSRPKAHLRVIGLIW